MKKHKMTLRNTKMFKETNAKTNRLQTSAIPYMQKILNKQYKKQQERLKSYLP